MKIGPSTIAALGLALLLGAPARGDEPVKESAPPTPAVEPAATVTSPPQTTAAVEEQVKKKKPKTLAILEFATNEKELEEKARSVGVLVATRLSFKPDLRVTTSEQVKAMLGLEKQRALLGCGESGCLTEISGALGVRYLLQGRLDRYGKKFVLSAGLYDTRSGLALARRLEDADSEEDLPLAADRLAAAIATDLEPAKGKTKAFEPDFHLNVKLGNTVPALSGFKFSAFNLRIDLEGDYYIRPFLLAFLEAGIVLARTQAESGGEGTNFSLVPVDLGLKYLFRHDKSVRPYAGLGLGLGIVAAFVDPASNGKLGLNLNGLVGVAWLPWQTFGFNVETSINLGNLAVTEGTKLLFGFNTNFGVLILF